jgi:hypothetical protein
MADRKGKQKEAVRKKKTAAVKPATPRNPARPPIIPPGLNELTEQVAFGDMADGSGTRIETAQEQPSHPMETTVSVGLETTASVGVETTIIRAVPALRQGWEASRDEVLSRAAEVVDLYQRLGSILTPAMPAPGSPGHNRRSILQEGLAELRDYQATAELATELFRERARPSDPDIKVIKQSGNVFKTLVHGTQAFGVTVSRWIAEGLVKGEVVKYAPGLVEQLVGALRTLAEVIASLLQ